MTARLGTLRNLVSVAVLATLSGTLWAQAPTTPPKQDPLPPKNPPAVNVAQPPAKPAATVNGEAILVGEVKALVDQQPPPPNPLTKAQQFSVQQAALEMLIDDLLMKQY